MGDSVTCRLAFHDMFVSDIILQTWSGNILKGFSSSDANGNSEFEITAKVTAD